MNTHTKDIIPFFSENNRIQKSSYYDEEELSSWQEISQILLLDWHQTIIHPFNNKDYYINSSIKEQTIDSLDSGDNFQNNTVRRTLSPITIKASTSSLSVDKQNASSLALSKRQNMIYISLRQEIEFLSEKIDAIFKEHQEEGWDGYDALPLTEENKEYAYKFVDSFLYSEKIIKDVDIIPENAGNFCFEWFKSDNKFISLSIKKDKLIFNYENEERKGCGEVNFADKNKIIQIIEEIA